MEKRQVLLIHMLPLLGDGLQRIFRQMEDIELVTLEDVDLQKVAGCLENVHPDIVVLAGEKEDDAATHLITYLLKHYEDIPIVWVELESNLLRLYTSHFLTANSAELIQAIRENDPNKMEVCLMGKKTQKRSKRR